jgi:hypothetical protein
MSGWHVFSYILGAFSCICVLGWRTYKNPDRDEDDGICWEDEDTEVYVRLQDRKEHS